MKHPLVQSVGLVLICSLLLGGGLSVEAQAGANMGAGPGVNGQFGSGDGRIRVIPALSAPSVKNGGKLTIQAVVKARAGVARVEAIIEGVARLELKPAGQNCSLGGPPMLPGAPAGISVQNNGQVARATMNGQALGNGLPAPNGAVCLYQTDWIAQDLKEKVYPVTLRVTDLAGHVYEDHSLSFSDPAAGNSTVGSTAYPAGTVPRRVGTMELKPGEFSFQCSVIDTAGGYAYFGVNIYPDSMAKGLVVKVRLSDFTRVGALQLNNGECALRCAVIDPVGGYAYFGAQGLYSGSSVLPATIIKIRLADFTRVGALTLNAGESNLRCAVIDPAGGYAYFGFYASPGLVVKVRLSDLTREGAITLGAAEDWLESAVIDPAGGYAYFGSGLGSVTKVRLSDFSRMYSIPVVDKKELRCAVIDPAGGYAYFGAMTSPGIVGRIRLSDFTLDGLLTLNSGENNLMSAAIDPAAGYAYFGAWAGTAIKIRLSDFTRVDAVTLNPQGQNNGLYAPASAVIDPGRGALYFSVEIGLGTVAKVRLADFTRTGELQCQTGDGVPVCTVVDAAAGYAYFGCYYAILKVRLSDFTRVATLTLNPDERNLHSAVIDPGGGYAYFGANTQPGKVIKVRLSDFTRVGVLTFNAGENYAGGAVIDPVAGYAYFGCEGVYANNCGIIIKVRLSDFTRAGVLLLNYGETVPVSAVIDPSGGYAYFGTSAYTSYSSAGSQSIPSKIVKVRLSSFTRVGALALNVGEGSLTSAIIDATGGYAYWGTDHYTTGLVIKVRLSDFTRVGALGFNYAENNLLCAALDAANGYAWFGGAGAVVKVRLSDFTRVGALSLNPEVYSVTSMAFDPASGAAWFGTSNTPPLIVKMALSCRNSLRANRITMSERGVVKNVQFYSHAAKGKLRLAIYNDATTKTLLWQSGALNNTKEGAWVSVPVALGTPSSLTLNPGQYWLAWQTDSTADVPSYAPGAADEGFVVDRPFGAFPARLRPAEITATSEKWSEYLTYDWQNAAVQWRMYP